MNFLFISPNYPSINSKLAAALAKSGINVLGIGDAGLESLTPQLREVIGGYYQVHDLHDYESVYRAAAYLISQNGRIDRVESLIPYWNKTCERLRCDYSVEGKALDIFEKEISPRPKDKGFTAVCGIADSNGRVLNSQCVKFLTADFNSFFTSNAKISDKIQSAVTDAKIRSNFFFLTFSGSGSKLELNTIGTFVGNSFTADILNSNTQEDIYQAWVDLQLGKEVKLTPIEKKGILACTYRGFDRSYANSHIAVLDRIKDNMIEYGLTESVYKYLFNAKTEREAIEIIDFIQIDF